MRRFTTALVLAGIVGCSGSTDSIASGDDAITDIPESRVKEQTVGNCWIYSTVAWVEALHLAHTKEELNLSESYLTYLHWFSRIRSGVFLFDAKDGSFNTGAFFTDGEELVARYGLMDEGAFISTEANLDRSARQEAAETAVKAALATGGALATPEKRADAANVRKVLNDAFKLPASVSAKLTRAFGADLSKTRGHGANIAASGFRDPAKMIVAVLADGKQITLDDALGEIDPNRPHDAKRDRSERRGPYAWQLVPFGKTKDERAASTLRLKKALNAGFPVAMDWFPAWKNFDRGDGSFKGVPDKSEGGGWHVSVAHDYQVNVPGTGVIPVGTVVHDPAVLAKTLQPEAVIELVRLKNSWGKGQGPAGLPGYTDTSWQYLSTDFTRDVIDYDQHSDVGPALEEFFLPPASWDVAGH
jgi:hypothetical protein